MDRLKRRRRLLFLGLCTVFFLCAIPKIRRARSSPWVHLHRPYHVNGSSICRATSPSPPLLLILVHSQTEHFLQRRVLRRTWASPKIIPGFRLRLAFLLGVTASDETQGQVQEEAREHGDIVQGAFLDAYRNLTLKHLMGYRWALDFCPTATFILKADDDVFVDVYRLSTFLRQTFVWNTGVFLCRVIPRGSVPRRSGKWKVTRQEYPFDAYPQYCSGMGYVLTPDVVRALLGVVSEDGSDFFWVDDVYVTGILAQKARLVQQAVNVRYTDDPEAVAKWLKSKSGKSSPFMFAEVADGADWVLTMKSLWDKTVRSWTNSKGAQ